MKFYLATLLLSAAAALGSAQTFDAPTDCVMLAKGNQAANMCSAGIHSSYPSGETMAVFPIVDGERPLTGDPFLCCKVTTRTDVSKCVANPDGDMEIGCRGQAGWAVRSQLMFGDDIARCCGPEDLQI